MRTWSDKKEERLKLTASCEHGVPGGKVQGLCNACKAEESERQRHAQMVVQAQALFKSEIERLRQERLTHLHTFLDLSPQRFEDAVANMFRKLGYQVQQTPYSNDGGKDAVLYKDGKKYLVECKRFGETHAVGRPMMQKFFAAMVEEDATLGYFVTTGRFSSTAVEYAKSNRIELIGPEKLIEGMRKAFPVSDGTTVQVMCTECGDLVGLPLKQIEVTGLCSYGHEVKNTITEVNVLTSLSAVPIQPGQKRRRRYRRKQ